MAASNICYRECPGSGCLNNRLEFLHQDAVNSVLMCSIPDGLWLQYLPYFTLLTVMALSFRTDISGQIVHTQIRLLIEEQSDVRVFTVGYSISIILTKYPNSWADM